MHRSIIPFVIFAVLVAGCAGNRQAPPATTPVPAVEVIPHGNNLFVHFIDVGQADAILVQTPNGGSMLVDSGDPDTAGKLVSYLKAHNVSVLDAVVASHPHGDHIGGMKAVLGTFGVGAFLDSGNELDAREGTETLTMVHENNVSYRIVRAGDLIGIDPDVRIEVLNPPPGSDLLEGVNENSVVLKIDYGRVGFLLMGDAENQTEELLLAAGRDVSSTFIKVGHHGSLYGATAPFLAAVHPQGAFIEAGAGNGFGFPAERTLNRLSAVGSEIYRTDLDGTIVVETDGAGYTIRCEKGCSGTRSGTGYSPDTSAPAPRYTYTFTCDCSSDCYNCTDFPNRTIAQACYEFCLAKGKGDVYSLDTDQDGFACLYTKTDT